MALIKSSSTDPRVTINDRRHKMELCQTMEKQIGDKHLPFDCNVDNDGVCAIDATWLEFFADKNRSVADSRIELPCKTVCAESLPVVNNSKADASSNVDEKMKVEITTKYTKNAATHMYVKNG